MPLPLDSPLLVTTWTQLRRRGHSEAHIKAELAAGRWRRWGHAIALHNGPLHRRQRMQVARLHAGPHALFTGFTCAELVGLKSWERERVDLLVPSGTRLRKRCPIPVKLHYRRE